GGAVATGAAVLRGGHRLGRSPASPVAGGRGEEIARNRWGVAAVPPAIPPREQTSQAIAAELAPQLVEALGSGTAPSGTRLYPGLTAVGRRQWVRFNIRIFRQMFEPLETLQRLIPGSLILSFRRRGITRSLGLMLGLLARRVLGQYDPALLGREPVEPSSLILVAPNVQAWAQQDQLPIDE